MRVRVHDGAWAGCAPLCGALLFIAAHCTAGGTAVMSLWGRGRSGGCGGYFERRMR